MENEQISCDVLIVGAGPSGLAAAIRLKQLNSHLHICVLEKGANVGAHILSGAVLEPRALNELLPNWHENKSVLATQVQDDSFLYLTSRRAWHLPVPTSFKNKNNFAISLGSLCQYLAQEAEKLGVEIYSGFPGKKLLLNKENIVCGVLTGDQGIGKDGQPTSRYQPGVAIKAKTTILAEGCRGSLSKQAIQHFKLNRNSSPQTYGLGIKEIWKVDKGQHQLGKVIHTIGWPLDHQTYGGGFIYHLPDQQVAVGFVVGLDYQNPYLDPFAELQRFKMHPAIRILFTNAHRISYGARSLAEGGVQALPRLDFPGGLIIGDSAGFLNALKIKGIHTAMKSGMIAAETVYAEDLTQYESRLKQSWLWQELYKARNIRPAFRWGLWPGLAYAALDTYILRGYAPWTFTHHADHLALKKAQDCKPIIYPKPDNQISFDKLSSVYLSNTNHIENQPVHLQLNNPETAIEINLSYYGGPEQFYCPAKVYEIFPNNNGKFYLQTNAQNCLHCKACDIKDPTQNIQWVPPEGGDGPNYSNM